MHTRPSLFLSARTTVLMWFLSRYGYLKVLVHAVPSSLSRVHLNLLLQQDQTMVNNIHTTTRLNQSMLTRRSACAALPCPCSMSCPCPCSMPCPCPCACSLRCLALLRLRLRPRQHPRTGEHRSMPCRRFGHALLGYRGSCADDNNIDEEVVEEAVIATVVDVRECVSRRIE